MHSRKWGKGLVIFGLVAMLAFMGAGPVKAAESILRIATAPVGAIMYSFGAAMSEVIGKHGGPKVEVLPQMALHGLAMFPTKECDLVMIANDDLSMAYRGEDIYKKVTKGKGFDVRLLMLGTRIPAGQVVAGDSGIKTYEDLRGKRVILVYGSSVALNMGSRAGLYGGGLTEKDVKVMKSADVVSACQMVIERKADACYGSVGVPIFQQLASARGGARHLGIVDTPENWKRVHTVFDGYFPMKINKGPLTVKEDIVMVGRNFTVSSRPDLSDESAYIFTKLLWENDKELGPKHPRLKDWVKAHFASTKAGAPYHPGAIKFYKEAGAWTPELDKHNQKLLAMRK
ncbi:MAG: TAXI family TRAP transporter solute-binding subunit [Pseudomonadota bacterium]